ncbi:MAG: branched-chain amino acid ABC transporter permease [Anaerolineae bacterium]|nr:MAG: branched-chain amino acid ABC transporter permease [Anaerolineae bacterium]
MGGFRETILNNRARLIIFAVLFILFFTAIRGMDTEDWTITLLRGLSVGAITFLVAAGLSLIFGLMDVLNLAHGELFMLGAYVGWTVYVRPDTFMDVLTFSTIIGAGLVLLPLWRYLYSNWRPSQSMANIWPWIVLAATLVLLFFAIREYPLSIWDPEDFTQSPGAFSLAVSQGMLVLPEPPNYESIPPAVGLGALFLGGLLLGVALVGIEQRKLAALIETHFSWRAIVMSAGLLILGLIFFWFNDPITEYLLNMNTAARFFLAMAVAALSGLGLGALVEKSMIRPLYDRPIYQIMLTLGLGFIIIEVVQAIWGRPGFGLPKADIFSGTGEGCPATNFSELLENQCSTIVLFDGRVRTYNEIFIILIGVVVLVGIWLLLQKTRIGMTIRAGVQDSEMVEALGINVRRVFTFVFALGVGLAALGGILAAPSIGLSPEMGTRLLLLALIALAVGGLTSFPGAAAGAVLVGLLQQFIIKYGQIGINLPFLDEPFKPTPPLVPASTVLLMVILLLVLPHGLFGRRE